MSEEKWVLAAWKLPLIVAAIAVSIVAGFYLGGPGLGMAVGGAAAASLVAMAVRNPPRHPIAPAVPEDGREHLLIVAPDPLEDPAAIEHVARTAHGDSKAEVRVLAPVRNGFLDRWACDVGPARERAQRSLVITLASLATAGVAATAGIGDENLVQAVDDQLRSYPATAVLLAGGATDKARRAVAELEARLRVPLQRLPDRAPRAVRRALL